MSKPIIQVENLSKQYRIGAREERQDTFLEAISLKVTIVLEVLFQNSKVGFK